MDAAKLASEIWLYREQLGLTPEHLDEMLAKFKENSSQVLSKSKFASFIMIKDLNSLTNVLLKTLPVLIISNDAIDIFRILSTAEGLVQDTISFASQKLALINILEEFSKIAGDLHSLTEKAKPTTANSKTAINKNS